MAELIAGFGYAFGITLGLFAAFGVVILVSAPFTKTRAK